MEKRKMDAWSKNGTPWTDHLSRFYHFPSKIRPPMVSRQPVQDPTSSSPPRFYLLVHPRIERFTVGWEKVNGRSNDDPATTTPQNSTLSSVRSYLNVYIDHPARLYQLPFRILSPSPCPHARNDCVHGWPQNGRALVSEPDLKFVCFAKRSSDLFGMSNLRFCVCVVYVGLKYQRKYWMAGGRSWPKKQVMDVRTLWTLWFNHLSLKMKPQSPSNRKSPNYSGNRKNCRLSLACTPVAIQCSQTYCTYALARHSLKNESREERQQSSKMSCIRRQEFGMASYGNLFPKKLSISI